jgi:uncharacterized membrane protein YfcA
MVEVTQEAPLPGEKSPLLSILVVAVMFLGGGAADVGLAMWLAPGSQLASFVAFLALPFAFVISLVLWQGLTLLILLVRLIAGRRGRAPREEALVTLRRKAIVMIPVPVVICAPVGLIVGLLGGGVLLSTAAFTVVGMAYGVGLWALAQKDLLPLLESA